MLTRTRYACLKSGVEGSPRKGEANDVRIAIDRLSGGAPAAVLYLLALGILYKFTNKWTAILLLVGAAVTGQFLFV